MIEIKVEDPLKRSFLLKWLNMKTRNDVIEKGEGLGLGYNNSKLMLPLIERFCEQKVTVLPLFTHFEEGIYWVVWAPSPEGAARAVQSIASFVTPVWAETRIIDDTFLFPDGTMEQFKCCRIKGLSGFFTPNYPAPARKKKLMELALEAIYRWVKLQELKESTQPETTEGSLDVFTLRMRFKEELSLNKWEKATSALTRLRETHSISDTNYLFLKLQLLGAQQRWLDILTIVQENGVADLKPMPLRVKEVILMAYYYAVFSSLEKQGIEVLRGAMGTLRADLSVLASSAVGLKEPCAIQVCAYDAWYCGDRERLKQHELINGPGLSIQDLLELMQENRTEDSIGEAIGNPVSSLESAKLAYGEGDFGGAFLHVLKCTDEYERLRLLVRLAHSSGYPNIIESARQAFENSDSHIQQLIIKDKSNKEAVKWIIGHDEEAESQMQSPVVPVHWGDFFGEVGIASRINRLSDLLEKRPQDTSWMPSSQEQWDELENALKDVSRSENTSPTGCRLISKALWLFTSELLREEMEAKEMHFGLYEHLWTAIISCTDDKANKLDVLRRLAEYQLVLNYTVAENLWLDLEQYLGSGRPVLRLSESVLKLLELFVDYGIKVDELSRIWNQWTSTLFSMMNSEYALEIESWLELGKIVGGNTDIINGLTKLLEEMKEQRELSGLNNKRIVIISTREGAAKRAIQRIKQRCTTVRIDFCGDERITDNIKNLVHQADVSVLVSTCNSHKLIDAMRGKEIVYPQDSGETSIIRCLETFARNLPHA